MRQRRESVWHIKQMAKMGINLEIIYTNHYGQMSPIMAYSSILFVYAAASY